MTLAGRLYLLLLLSSQVILAKNDGMRRRRQSVLLDLVDIPAASLDVMRDEVLGLGGFGTVYLADLGGGINAAAKIVAFKPDRHGRSGGGDDDDDGTDDSDDNSDDSGSQGYQSEEEAEIAADPTDVKARRKAAVAKAKRAAYLKRMLTRDRLAFCRELEAMKRLRGPNTVHTYGAVTSLGRHNVRVEDGWGSCRCRDAG